MKEQIHKNNGYTLIEMLLVLLLISSILLIVIPNFTKSVHSKNVDYFFEQLEKDLYESQMTAMTDGVIIRFVFSPTLNNYTIRHGVTIVETRTFPEGLTVKIGTLGYNDLRFLPTGTISSPGSLVFNYKNDRYVLVFQFVRGRFYIDKQ
ncbi:competence protein ComGD [Evansella vedderi]|uniref:Competence protein ComGD n=1 Tax=Evansella vedderi TaxID=38282 RepID=A0ABT9ZZZ4_9BACI|nr:competence type IV pilus minor pilin ComGD [Evansella vedderi]MDQ0256286.1 competence protein ComGD [Evansella vedderi]